MPNEMEIRKVVTYITEIPAPGERYLGEYIKSDIIHSMPAKTPISTLGENWAGGEMLPDTITVGISHAIT